MFWYMWEYNCLGDLTRSLKEIDVLKYKLIQKRWPSTPLPPDQLIGLSFILAKFGRSSLQIIESIFWISQNKFKSSSTNLKIDAHSHSYKHNVITFFFMVPPFLGKKMAFCPKIKKTLSWAVFQEALIVAPLFLDICLDIFGAWNNPPQKIVWDILF